MVLNFWASWCQPCVIEHPYLLRAAKHYEGRVSFIGVVPSEDREEAVNQFYSRFGSWGPAYHDSDGKVSIAYGVFKLPETYFIDAEGTIRYKPRRAARSGNDQRDPGRAAVTPKASVAPALLILGLLSTPTTAVAQEETPSIDVAALLGQPAGFCCRGRGAHSPNSRGRKPHALPGVSRTPDFRLA